MALHFFPHYMGSFKSSSYEKALAALRILGLLIVSTLYFHYFFAEGPHSLVLMTNWGVMLTTGYFFCCVMGYFINFLDKFNCIYFLVVWAFNWDITVAFWGYLFPINKFEDYTRACLTHSVPLAFTLADFALNRISFIRIQFIVPILVLAVYLLFVLVPYTLVEDSVYTGITFKNPLSFIITVGLFLLAWGMLELGKLFKDRVHQESSLEKDLLRD